jgi:hypothetical protein
MAANRIKREILIRAGSIAVRARLLDTPTADRMWQMLPIYTTAEMRGGALALQAHVPIDTHCGVTRRLEQGEIAICAAEHRVLIACRPASDEFASCTVWALALDDVTALSGVCTGDRVALLEADS